MPATFPGRLLVGTSQDNTVLRTHSSRGETTYAPREGKRERKENFLKRGDWRSVQGEHGALNWIVQGGSSMH